MIKRSEKGIGYRFSMLHRIHFALASEEICPLGITMAQLPFLMVLLDRNTPVTQDEMAKAVAIDPGAAARNLEHLEKKGFVHRKVNPKNRRQKLVSPSEKTLKLEKEIYAALRNASNILVEGLTGEEQETALNLLDRMLDNAMNAKEKRQK